MPTDDNVIPLISCADCQPNIEADTVGRHNLCDQHFHRRAVVRAISLIAIDAVRAGVEEDDILGAAHVGIEVAKAGIELPEWDDDTEENEPEEPALEDQLLRAQAEVRRLEQAIDDMVDAGVEREREEALARWDARGPDDFDPPSAA